MLAGILAAVTVLGAALEFPVAPQTVYAEDVGLPEEANQAFEGEEGTLTPDPICQPKSAHL